MTRQDAIERQNQSFPIYFDGVVIKIGGKILRAARRDGAVTIARCKEIVEIANRAGHAPKKLEVNMSEYDYESIDDEYYDLAVAGDCDIPKKIRKKAYYCVATNCLQIWQDGLPIYENNNGTICRDHVALSDSLC